MLEEDEIDGDGDDIPQRFTDELLYLLVAIAVMEKVACDTSSLYVNQPGYQEEEVGYILDESDHLKKGRSQLEWHSNMPVWSAKSRIVR